jgi:hypothetical protein
LVVGGWWLVVGGWWLLVVGCWLLVVGWWLVVGGYSYQLTTVRAKLWSEYLGLRLNLFVQMLSP